MALAHRVATIDSIPAPGYRRYLFPLTFGVLFLAFFAAPWPLSHKAHAVLHGLCAQVPSHTLQLGGQALPFDARMTGIYGGFLVTGIYLCAHSRYRATRLPSWRSIAVLVSFVGVMAVDGTNSFLRDMLLWHPYTPDNRLRLATGLLTGVALAIAITFLLASTLWRKPLVTQPVINGPRELLLITALQVPFAVACTSTLGFLFVPITVYLLSAAVLALTGLMLATVVLLKRTDCSFAGVAEIQTSAFIALLLALGVIFFFSGGRFLLENFVGPPALT
jgi:uncharacterized membrane protein